MTTERLRLLSPIVEDRPMTVDEIDTLRRYAEQNAGQSIMRSLLLTYDTALARLQAAERVVDAARVRDEAEERHHALELDYGQWHPEVVDADDRRRNAKQRYRDALNAYDAHESEAVR